MPPPLPSAVMMQQNFWTTVPAVMHGQPLRTLRTVVAAVVEAAWSHCTLRNWALQSSRQQRASAWRSCGVCCSWLGYIYHYVVQEGTD